MYESSAYLSLLTIKDLTDSYFHETMEKIVNQENIACECLFNGYYYPPPIPFPAARPTTLNFIISCTGLREQLVSKVVFDILDGTNNICECECKCGFNGYYYTTPFTTQINFNGTDNEISGNNVLRFIVGFNDNQNHIINDIIIEINDSMSILGKFFHFLNSFFSWFSLSWRTWST